MSWRARRTTSVLQYQFGQSGSGCVWRGRAAMSLVPAGQAGWSGLADLHAQVAQFGEEALPAEGEGVLDGDDPERRIGGPCGVMEQRLELDPVFVGGDHGGGAGSLGGMADALQVGLGVAVVVGPGERFAGLEAKFGTGAQEAVRVAHSADREDGLALGLDRSFVGVDHAGGLDLGAHDLAGEVLPDLAFDGMDVLAGGLVAACDDDGRGTGQAAERLAQEPAGEQGVSTEGVEGVDEDQVGMSVEAAMLEAVVEDQCAGFLIEGHPGGQYAVWVDDDGYAGQAFAQLEDFVAGRVSPAHVAACEDGRGVAPDAQKLADERGHGGLAGSAGGDVADGDGGHVEAGNEGRVAVVATVAQGHGQSVDAGCHAQKHARLTFPAGLRGRRGRMAAGPEPETAGLGRRIYPSGRCGARRVLPAAGGKSASGPGRCRCRLGGGSYGDVSLMLIQPPACSPGRPLGLVVLLTLGPALWLGGCADKPVEDGARTSGRSGGSGGGQARGARFTPPANAEPGRYRIVVTRITGPNRIQAAENLLRDIPRIRTSAMPEDANTMRRVEVRVDPSKLSLVHEEEASYIHYGEYDGWLAMEGGRERLVFAPATTRDLHMIQGLELVDQRGGRGQTVYHYPFQPARLEPIQEADPAIDPAWLLVNAPPGVVYSLQIGFYTGPQRKQYAVDAVKKLRADGVKAFVFHGPSRSIVTVGEFGSTAVVRSRPDAPVSLSAEVLEFIRAGGDAYRYNLRNGTIWKRVLTDEATGRPREAIQHSFLVAVQSARAESLSTFTAPAPHEPGRPGRSGAARRPPR